MTAVGFSTMFWAPWVFVFGLLIGSFLNVVIYRLPKGESIAWPGSHCPRCLVPLKWWENIPLASFLGLRGRCRSCREPISWRYPVVEALTGVLFVGVYLSKGLPQGILWAIFCALLVAIFWIDIDEMLILHVTTIPGILLGIGYHVWTGQWLGALLAAVAGFAFFEGVYYLSLWILKKEGMGQGDAMLAAMLGAWLGPVGLLIALYLSFLFGSVVGLALRFRHGESRPFPFGPAMVAGAFISLFWGANIWHWYQQCLRM